MRYVYPATIEDEPEGVTITFPDVPEAITWGETREAALSHAPDALITGLSCYVDAGQKIPTPSPSRGGTNIAVTALEATKLALHDAMLAADISNAELARRLKCDEKAIRRLRDPLHASKIEHVETALRMLGKRIDISVVEAA
jgi:antitoxin HicB